MSTFLVKANILIGSLQTFEVLGLKCTYDKKSPARIDDFRSSDLNKCNLEII